MPRYIVIEDERFAFDELKRMMQKLRPDYVLAGWAQGVEQAVLLLEQTGLDLIITDIRLADGLCFDVFDRVPTSAPVIFTTAYDEYALSAFKLNSVDYLLKPIDEADLQRALSKFERNGLVRAGSQQYAQVERSYMSRTLKSRFLIRVGDTFRYVPTADVAFFYSVDKTTYIGTLDGKNHIIDYSLDSLEAVLDPRIFFRVSRGCIANIKTISRVSKFFGGRLNVCFKPECPVKVTVSRNRATDFLRWMDDNDSCHG